MEKTRLSQLSDAGNGHILKDVFPGKYIYSGGLSFMQPNECSHGDEIRHVHDDHEAFIIFQGRGKLETDGGVYDISAGDVIIIAPGENHHLLSGNSEPLTVLWCHAR